MVLRPTLVRRTSGRRLWQRVVHGRSEHVRWNCHSNALAWYTRPIAFAYGQALIPSPPLSEHRHSAGRLALFPLTDRPCPSQIERLRPGPRRGPQVTTTAGRVSRFPAARRDPGEQPGRSRQADAINNVIRFRRSGRGSVCLSFATVRKQALKYRCGWMKCPLSPPLNSRTTTIVARSMKPLCCAVFP
jgi:hypothetical protein